MSKFIMFKVL